MAESACVELMTVEVIAHMPRCRDCRWWTDRGGDIGTCERGEYEKAGMWGVGDRTVMTRPDFGCVQFQAREVDNG